VVRAGVQVLADAGADQRGTGRDDRRDELVAAAACQVAVSEAEPPPNPARSMARAYSPGSSPIRAGGGIQIPVRPSAWRSSPIVVMVFL
jgi:hypothetical protein